MNGGRVGPLAELAVIVAAVITTGGCSEPARSPATEPEQRRAFFVEVEPAARSTTAVPSPARAVPQLRPSGIVDLAYVDADVLALLDYRGTITLLEGFEREGEAWVAFHVEGGTRVDVSPEHADDFRLRSAGPMLSASLGPATIEHEQRRRFVP